LPNEMFVLENVKLLDRHNSEKNVIVVSLKIREVSNLESRFRQKMVKYCR